MNTPDRVPLDGQSMRVQGGSARIAYRPGWSSGKPYHTYSNGTAQLPFATLNEAKRFLGDKHLSWTWSDWT